MFKGMWYSKWHSWSSVVARVLGLLTITACSTWSAQTNFVVIPAISTNLAGSVISLAVTQINADLGVPAAYQWAKGGTNLVDGDRVSGAQAPVLLITGAEVADGGTYRVTLTLTNGTEASASSIVYVVAQPRILRVYSETVGDDMTFSVEATGGLLSYQWMWQSQPLAGATTSAFKLVNAYSTANAGYYTVQVTNIVGSVTSSPGILFTKPTPSGTYQGLFYDTNGVVPESSGYLQCSISGSKSSFSGKLWVGNAPYRFSGAFSADHVAEVKAHGSAGPDLTLRLRLLTTNSAPRIGGTVSDGSWTSALLANRLPFSNKMPTGLAGKYTLALQNTNTGLTVPQGSGYGAVTVRANGGVRISGLLPDGTKFTQSCGLAAAGEWPLRAILNKERGVLIGWLQIIKQSGSSIRGNTVAWVKDAGPDQLYPEGFGISLLPAGSIYALPQASSSGLLISSGTVTFYGGDLVSDGSRVWDAIKVTWDGSSTFVGEESAEHIRLKLNKATGVLTGSFIHFVTGAKTPVRGVVLQQQNFGRGYFISSGASGSFTLEPAP